MVRLSAGDGVATFAVTDHGIGIDHGDHARIFGRFERAVSERHYGGLGLGLWIVQRVLHAMGGSVEVDSEPARGATLTVRLPLSGPPAVASREREGLVGAAGVLHGGETS